ncbi:conserved hypothetical protein [Hahella chejuensis KCTC 2396]|uniref:Uncharacterized protein n=1 Tax=Hahella chejuensis (strain KCTC 2396) TaxID=349521 RepID=Q2SFS2_HAHCH|nr:hypothetical protein [Hahella chejuensis]ABC30502.1 conserved hypothetical protein [Hahella chejuensis KCTC 2396]
MSQEKLVKMDFESLLKLIEEENTDACEFCRKQDLRGWSNITPDTSKNIKPIAEFEGAEESIKKNGYTEYHVDGTNYWSKDAPIAIHFYPYHESYINVCMICKAVFLTYTEYAGHGPQNRIRYVDKKLVTDNY